MKRFDKFNIRKRPSVLALLHYEDDFFDASLRKYSFKEALHLYLKREGFTKIIYFSIGYGLHSYEGEMLKDFLSNEENSPSQNSMPQRGHTGSNLCNLQPTSGQGTSMPQRGHLGSNLCGLNTKFNQGTASNVRQLVNGIYVDCRGQLSRDAQIAILRYNLTHSKKCAIIVEPSENESEFTNQQKPLLGTLIHDLKDNSDSSKQNVFILLGKTDLKTGFNVPEKLIPGSPSMSTSDFWRSDFFQSTFFESYKDEQKTTIYQFEDVSSLFGPVFVLPSPTAEDCKHAFMYWRIVNGNFHNVEWQQMNDLCLQMSHVRGINADEGTFSIRKWEKVFLENYKNMLSCKSFEKKYGIQDRNSEIALNRLDEMQGIDEIREQFHKYCCRLAKERQKQDSIFRPHMKFVGNPGTGKTTIARLFAQILKDKGLLTKGHLVSVTAADLIGEYIGQTRPKTAKVCESAIGGILFIDEAYGLYPRTESDSKSNSFGKEAVEIILQYMENYKNDLIFIFAGYEDDLNYTINNSNDGFKSRFDDVFGLWKFNSYSPEVLYNIAMHHFHKNNFQTTDEFNLILRTIITIRHTLGQTSIGNARYVENLAGAIMNHRSVNGILTKDDIPIHERKLVDTTLWDEREIFAKMNSLVGQDSVKTCLKNIYVQRMVQMIKCKNNPNKKPESVSYAYMLIGPSGTGKTTFARIIADILYNLGIMPGDNSGYFTEISGRDIIRTGQSFSAIFEANRGKTIFIDEAYELNNYPSYINDLVGEMQKPEYRYNVCIILAGYTEEMTQLMLKNQGLSTRFPRENKIQLQNYSDSELSEMLFRRQNSELRICEEGRMLATAYFTEIREVKTNRNNPLDPFANAREVDNLLAELIKNRDIRFANASAEDQMDLDFAITVISEDFPNFLEVNSISDK